MSHMPAKGSISVAIEGHVVDEKFEYYEGNWYRPVIVDKVVDALRTKEEGRTLELEAFVSKELKKGDRILAQPYASFLSAGAEFVLMNEKGRYELLLSGVFTPDDKNAYGNLSVSGLKITEKLSGPRRAWNYLKEL